MVKWVSHFTPSPTLPHRVRNVDIREVQDAFSQRPTDDNRLFDDHAGRKTMVTNKIFLGAFKTLLDKLESDYRQEVVEELKDLNVEL